jgi:hypothetical protein
MAARDRPARPCIRPAELMLRRSSACVSCDWRRSSCSWARAAWCAVRQPAGPQQQQHVHRGRRETGPAPPHPLRTAKEGGGGGGGLKGERERRGTRTGLSAGDDHALLAAQHLAEALGLHGVGVGVSSPRARLDVSRVAVARENALVPAAVRGGGEVPVRGAMHHGLRGVMHQATKGLSSLTRCRSSSSARRRTCQPSGSRCRAGAPPTCTDTMVMHPHFQVWSLEISSTTERPVAARTSRAGP